MKVFLDIFTILRPERNELVASILNMFTNFRPERNELSSRFLAIIRNLRLGKEWASCSIFRYFYKVEGRKE